MTAASATDILIAASEIDDRLLECLASYRALFVRTFEEAQQALREHLFRLIVIDLNFDNVRMFDLLDHLRMVPALSGVPVVCVQGAAPGAGLSAALDRLVRNLGAEAFVDLRGLQEAAGAFQRLSHMLQQREPAPPLARAALCVLIIDHDVGAAFRLGEIVEQAGHDVDLAYDAGSGLDAARRLRPDAVFIELALPRMNGFQLAQRLRSESSTREVLIIALAPPQSSLERIREAGFDHHVVKPADPEIVRRLLGALAPLPVR